MRRFFLSGLLLTTWAYAGVSVEHASHADFSQYRTFSFVEKPAAEETSTQDPQIAKWLRDAVTRELRDKGLQMLAQGGDLQVRAVLEVREDQRVEVDIFGEGSMPPTDVTKISPGENAREVGTGTLVVELLDGYSKLTVWQGVAGAVTRVEPGKGSQKRIDKAVTRMFKKYPPR